MKILTSKCEDTQEAAGALPSHPSLLIKFANGKLSSMGQLKLIHPKQTQSLTSEEQRAS